MLILPPTLKPLKRSDLMAEEIKRWIADRQFAPGDRLPREAELQKLFSVSKATAREGLKSLEVQGFINISTGPAGGATVAAVPFDRTFQFVQNHLFFRNVSMEDVYAVRLLTEPELAAGAVPFLTKDDFQTLERSIEICSQPPATEQAALEQRQEDLRFHDVLARANPNSLLRFVSETINELIRQVVVIQGRPLGTLYQQFGRHNVSAHRALLRAARERNAGKVRTLMKQHIRVASRFARGLKAEVVSKLVLDGDVRTRVPSPGRIPVR
jgi:DNA-binding FadR family transcriptional regulator